MNRRAFLSALAVIPFVRRMPCVKKAVAISFDDVKWDDVQNLDSDGLTFDEPLPEGQFWVKYEGEWRA